MVLNTEEEFDSAFSGSDRITSPFIRPRNPDMHSSIRLKLSAAKLFSANHNFSTPTSPISEYENRKRSNSRLSDDSTFIVETRPGSDTLAHPVKTYV